VVGALPVDLAEALAAPPAAGTCGAAAVIARGRLDGALAWAAHLALSAVVLPLPADLFAPSAPRAGLARLARSVAEALVMSPGGGGGTGGAGAGAALWIALDPAAPGALPGWLRLHAALSLGPRLGVLLEVDGASAAPALSAWSAEPVRALALGGAAFVPNATGHPVLPRSLQAAAARGVELCWQLVVGPVGPDAVDRTGMRSGTDAGTASSAPPLALAARRRAYLAHLFSRLPVRDGLAREASGSGPYADALQTPLQPLADDLTSLTYGVFERDAPKYRAYGRAVRMALEDIVAAVEEKGETPGPLRIVVMGAGRGPLVWTALAAARGLSAGVGVRVWAVEKNPNACATLRALAAARPEQAPSMDVDDGDIFPSTGRAPDGTMTEHPFPWRGFVAVVKGDGRAMGAAAAAARAAATDGSDGAADVEAGWDAWFAWVAAGGSGGAGGVEPTAPSRPPPCDLMVSELLGSLGCNEAHPECVEAARPLLRRAGWGPRSGRMVPASCETWLGPVAAGAAWQAVDAAAAAARGGGWVGGRAAGRGGGVPGPPPLGGVGEGGAFETPAVVRLSRWLPLGEPRLAWRFVHDPCATSEAEASKPGPSEGGADPRSDPTDGPERECWLEWAAPSSSSVRGEEGNGGASVLAPMISPVCHGIAGYFRSVLWARREGESVTLSTIPGDAHTPGMQSWFPALLPLRSPVDAQGGVSVGAWRRSETRAGGRSGGWGGSGGRFWYEWLVETPGRAGVGGIHNPGGRSSAVGL